jgi:hypothetical protein
MNKIWILVGIILFICFLLGAWVFLGEFNLFSKKIGEGSKDIVLPDKTKIIGTWETQYNSSDRDFIGLNGIYSFSSDDKATIGGISCTWILSDSDLVITIDENSEQFIYNYMLSNDGATFTLSKSDKTYVFVKK